MNAATEALFENLACPKHLCPLEQRPDSLICPAGCEYPVVDGIPVLLRNDKEQTLWVAEASLTKAEELRGRACEQPDYCVETLGLGAEERKALARKMASWSGEGIDPVASHLVGATNGILYQSLIGKVPAYPIPELRVPDASGACFLDIGCNWGRWCVAAARRGYSPVGIDPSLGAVMAARRICRQLGIRARFIVADARYLPFPQETFDVVFSYSVLQHFRKESARLALAQVARVLKSGGTSFIQMPNRYGVRCLYHQARRGFREPRNFGVRYWSPAELRKTFEKLIGPSSLSVDCFFGLGIQESDKQLLPPGERLVVNASRLAYAISQRAPWLQRLADSLYIQSVRQTA